MSSDNLSFNVNTQHEIPDSLPVESAQPLAQATPAGIAGQESTIAPSGVQQIATASEASVPMIPYPVLFQFFDQNGVADPGEGALSISAANQWSLKESEIVLSMLTKWNDSIKTEIAGEKRRLADPNEVRKREESLPTSSVLNAIIDSASHPGESRGDIVPLLTVGLIFAGTGGVSDAMMIDTQSTRMVGVNPAANQAPDVAIYTSDLRAELGLLGAAMLQGAAYTANANSIFKMGGSAPDQVTAKAYANQIMKLVSSNQLTLIVERLVAQESQRTGKPADPALVKQLESQLKVILLSTALAALYTSELEGGTGWIRGDEFVGLLDGSNETFGNNKELMDQIISQIRTQLAGLPNGGKDITQTLANYFNQNPSLKTLTNPSKVFAQLIPYIRGAEDHSV